MADSVYRTSLRSHMAGELRAPHAGASITLVGWVHRRRDLGGLIFIDLRDREGVAQISCGPDWTKPEALEVAKNLGGEAVIAVEGEVVRRPLEAVNAEMATGEVEVKARVVTLLARAEVPVIPVAYGPDDELAAEEMRLRYRYLDLRRHGLQAKLRMRHKAAQAIRDALVPLGFVEIETPLLTRPTPEGARDYLTPSRIHKGEFYALPQSPQLYKQILMVSGFDRYFQIARCLRDEDLRHDRQPEFTQLDLEMSFVVEDDVLAVGEQVMSAIWKECLGGVIERPFPRMSYADALELYGTDKPDLRIPWRIVDLSGALGESEFRIFRAALESGGRVRGLRVPEGAALSRKVIDEFDRVAQDAGAAGVLWTKLAEGGAQGGFGGKLASAELAEVRAAASATDGDLLLVVAGADEVTGPALDALRRHTAQLLDAVQPGDRFLWITEFPLFERDPNTGEPAPIHHPFTSPVIDDVERLESDPLSVRSRAYDLVYNGTEFGSGSIRISDAPLQRRVFEALGIDADEAERKFGFLLEAFKFGAPPHGGFAFGFDRIAMHLTGSASLRDVIAFPKTTTARGLMENAPAPVTEEEMSELGISINERADARVVD